MAHSDCEEMPWHLGVYDAHCHPTDTLASLKHIPGMNARVLTVMSTREQDQDLVANAAATDSSLTDEAIDAMDGAKSVSKFLPSFGWHPWFSYQLFDEIRFHGATSLSLSQKVEHYKSVLTPSTDDEAFFQSLPEPRPLAAFLEQTRQRLHSHPLALVGEIGLDRSFRLPVAWDDSALNCRDAKITPGGREGRELSPYKVNMDHQKLVLSRQLNLAGELGRPVSVHGVRAPGILFETLASTWKGHELKTRRQAKKDQVAAAEAGHEPGEDVEQDEATMRTTAKPFPPRICLHSYSSPPETVKMFLDPKIPAEIYFSFSMAVNFDWPKASKAEEALKKVPDDRVLVESDSHTAGPTMDKHLEQGVRRICAVKGWGLEEGVRILGRNWKRFVFGGGYAPGN